MPYFRKTKFTAKEGDKWWVYEPTVYKKGKDVVFIKNKSGEQPFLKKRRK